jgi:hypothetical protein
MPAGGRLPPPQNHPDRVPEEGGAGVVDPAVLQQASEPVSVGVIADHQRPLGHAGLVPEPDLSSERNHAFQYRRPAVQAEALFHPATAEPARRVAGIGARKPPICPATRMPK